MSEFVARFRGRRVKDLCWHQDWIIITNIDGISAEDTGLWTALLIDFYPATTFHVASLDFGFGRHTILI